MPQKLRCRVIEILDHGDRVYSIFLKPEILVPRFLPGQFLHLALDAYSPGDFWPDSRSFSIASSPADRSILRITYAVKGLFTGRMEAELHPGCEIWVKMPYGEFVVNSGQDVCLLAGGTGVTAFTAFLASLSMEHLHNIYLFYGARNPGLLIYRSLVEASRLHCPNLHVWYLAEQDVETDHCLLGRLEAAAIFQSIPNPSSINYYIAGPPEMVSSLSAGLGKLGVSPGCMMADAWE
jgi:ferredoxin-NADP reductase